MTKTFSGISRSEAPMQRPVVEEEDEMAVRIPDEAGAKAVAAEAKIANVAAMRGVREIMVGFRESDITPLLLVFTSLSLWLKIRCVG